jgi:hypothetical protein
MSTIIDRLQDVSQDALNRDVFTMVSITIDELNKILGVIGAADRLVTWFESGCSEEALARKCKDLSVTLREIGLGAIE